MQKFLTHDAVAQGWFGLGKTSSSSAICQWEADLANTDRVLELMCERLQSDYESLAPKMRKAWTSKDVAAWRETTAIGLM